jgi:hypothetical protein
MNPALKKLHGIKVEVVSMTCDAPLTNLPILKKLGASFDFSGIKSSFSHPSDHTKSVAVILDMLKLA